MSSILIRFWLEKTKRIPDSGGVAQSRKYLAELRVTIQLLAETPALGKGRPDVGPDVFSFPQGSHVIYYLVHGQQIVVFGVLHRRMVPLNHLADRYRD